MKNQYRKFNIRSEGLTPGDDYAMMREVLGTAVQAAVEAAGGRGTPRSRRTTSRFRNGPTSSSSTAAAPTECRQGDF